MSVSVGIDVSKATLDVAIHGSSAVRAFPNNAAGFRQLAAWLKPQLPLQVVLEATGGYEQAALDALFAAGLPMVRVNPRQVRDFCEGVGPVGQDRSPGCAGAGPLCCCCTTHTLSASTCVAAATG